jgi:hypothetical protein
LSVDVAEVRLLSEVLEESSKSLEIKLNLQWLTTPLVDELHELLSLHPGKKRVKLHVIDAEEKLDIKLPVKEFKVTIAKDLLQVLEQHEHLQPKVIS